MTTVVKSSSSVYSTYISTVDHLPCDIVRSLWLVQACNVAADTEKQRLHEYLKEFTYHEVQKQPNRQEIFKIYREMQQRIMRWNSEAMAELENLDVMLKAHQALLRRGIDMLHRTAHAGPLPDQRERAELLKSQLDEHYRETPLISQVEALQERVLKGSRSVIIKHVPGQATGVKIILKLGKQRLASCPVKEVAVDKTNEPATSEEGEAGPTRPVRKRTRSQILQTSEKLPHGRNSSKDAGPVSTLEIEGKPVPLKKIKLRVKEAEYSPSEKPEQYCFCRQPSFGDMIACDNKKCPNGEWFHYKCVGLLNRAAVSNFKSQAWFCSDSCKTQAQASTQKKKRRKRW